MNNDRINIQRLLLETLMNHGDTLQEDMLIPRAVELLYSLHPENTEYRKVKPEYVLRRTLKRLSESGYIEEQEEDEMILVTLSHKGKKKLLLYQDFRQQAPDHTETWDGKWRILILDIPEDQKSLRDRIRTILNNQGFMQLKNSIWVHKNDCQDLVTAIRNAFGLHKQIMYIVAESIDVIC